MSTDMPDFRVNRDVIIKAWGEPTTEKNGKLSWSSGNQYGEDWRSYDDRKRLWYDRASKRGGKTVLDLARFEQGKPPLAKGERLRGAEFIAAWQYAFDQRWIDKPPQEKGNGKGGDWPPIRATYPYRDEDGAVLFGVVRFDTADPDKRFRQRQPDGKGGWISNIKGVRRVLYRLPELIAAVKAGERVLICEGEKDANTAVRLGYTATTAPEGINKWRKEYDEFLRGADLVIVSDNDQQARDKETGKLQFHPDGRPILPGQDYAAKQTRRLRGIAAQLRMIIPPVKDLSEWIEAGGTREALDELIAQSPDQAKQQPQPQQDDDDIPADGGLEDRVALDFSALHADRLRYVALWNKWLEWDGARWRFETTLHAFDLSRELCRDAQDADHKTVAAVVALARTDRRQAATVEQWDANLWLLGTPGGTIDLRTGKLMPAQQGDYITKITSVTSAREPPAQSCQVWLEFLQLVTGGSEERQDFLQRVCGYGLTGLTIEDSLFFLWGLGANGKSVFLRTVSGVAADYHKTASMEMFTVTMSERHPTDLAMLRGARLVTAFETEEGKRWDESKLKALTGGDPIPARFMRQDFFEYVPQFKLLIAGNHKPSFRNVDEAIRRRVKLVPFTVTIPEAERDKNFSKKLIPEWPGILRWMIEGCLAWQRDGLKPPADVRYATNDYLTGQDDLQRFIDDACVLGPNESDTSAHLWDGWTDWAEDHREFVGSQRRFSDRLLDKGFVNDKSGKGGTRIFKGIRCIRENTKKAAAELRRRADEARAREAEAKANAAEDRAANVSDAEDTPF
jgi:putative DNA primase/helicase